MQEFLHFQKIVLYTINKKMKNNKKKKEVDLLGAQASLYSSWD